MKLKTKVYRGGSSQDLIPERPYDVTLDNEKKTSLDVRVRTNPNGKRQSTILVAFGPEAYPALLERMAQNIASDHPAFAAILQAIALALSKSLSS